ncbi:MAG TPA: hypothetical protein VM925_29730 [Labilithrix sp.]|nr:hypothetical protein [Labilithrix sp.]
MPEEGPRDSNVDPLARVLRSGPVRGRGTAAKPFASGEHVWLGSRGAAKACKEAARQGLGVDASIFSAIRRRRGDLLFDYGELVALSGDFYGSPEALFDEKPSPVPWLWEANDISDLRETFDVELGWIEGARSGPRPPPYPDNNIRQAWNAKWYVELALRNVDHFGWHNLVAYCTHHARALEMAAEAKGEESERFFEALVHNAFADHFLTDGFAAGHVRVPRAEILAWANERGWSDKRAGALSKLLHDQDGHIASIHSVTEKRAAKDEGLPVVNARGDEFFARCDGQLFLGGGHEGGGAVDLATEAVAASVLELLLAWRKGTMPDGTYAATVLVPFPAPGSSGLAEKFPGDLSETRLEALFDSLAWYSGIPWIGPGLERDHVRELFAALPELMSSFGRSVTVACAASPTLRTRLPRLYVDAYEKVR